MKAADAADCPDWFKPFVLLNFSHIEMDIERNWLANIMLTNNQILDSTVTEAQRDISTLYSQFIFCVDFLLYTPSFLSVGCAFYSETKPQQLHLNFPARIRTDSIMFSLV
jgi:hypothetical protein